MAQSGTVLRRSGRPFRSIVNCLPPAERQNPRQSGQSEGSIYGVEKRRDQIIAILSIALRPRTSSIQQRLFHVSAAADSSKAEMTPQCLPPLWPDTPYIVHTVGLAVLPERNPDAKNQRNCDIEVERHEKPCSPAPELCGPAALFYY